MNKSNFSGMDTSKYPGYKEALTKLQEAHPNWTIKLVMFQMDLKTLYLLMKKKAISSHLI